MRLQKLEPNADPESAAAIIEVQCAKCKGFAPWNDAAASGWRRDLDGHPFFVHYCGVCIHDLFAQVDMSQR